MVRAITPEEEHERQRVRFLYALLRKIRNNIDVSLINTSKRSMAIWERLADEIDAVLKGAPR